MNIPSISIVCFRNDLRLADNPALSHAIESSDVIIPIYIWDDSEPEWKIGSASKSWLHHSLHSLNRSLQQRNSSLIIRKGNPQQILAEVCKETGADKVYWNRRYEPHFIKSDSQTKSFLESRNIQVHSFNSSLLIEPWEIKNKSGKPFQVFTPFWRTHQRIFENRVVQKAPTTIPSGKKINSLCVDDLKLTPPGSWDKSFYEKFQPGEKGARIALHNFVSDSVSFYERLRNYPSTTGTSCLSPHLHFGEISPHQVYEFISRHSVLIDINSQVFLREIGWREFAHHLLYYFPQTTDKPLKEQFIHFPWNEPSEQLDKWKQGKTGIPIVDAGMRELWSTGWMHNRVRMIVASFLVKNLMIDWRYGAQWFWDTLVDADLANNTLGWQWVAGCGADAAPYFRVFNPILQSQKFDPKGDYIKRWVPELREAHTNVIHTPWEDELLLKKTGYPYKCCSLQESRATALHAYESIKNQ